MLECCRWTLDERLRASAEKGCSGCRPQAASQRATLSLSGGVGGGRCENREFLFTFAGGRRRSQAVVGGFGRSQNARVCPMRRAIVIGVNPGRVGCLGGVYSVAVGCPVGRLVSLCGGDWWAACRVGFVGCRGVCGERVESSHVVLLHLMSCLVVSCRVVSCRVGSGRVGSGRVGSCHFTSRHAMSCHVMSCHAVFLT